MYANTWNVHFPKQKLEPVKYHFPIFLWKIQALKGLKNGKW